MGDSASPEPKLRMVASTSRIVKVRTLVDLTDQPMGSERASVKQRMNLQWSEGGGECAICSTGSVLCSVQCSWYLVPPLFRLGGSASMCLRNTRQATTRSPGSPSD